MKVNLQEYQAIWQTKFEEEKKAIASALKSWRPKIEHIGSTSVPGLKAKPIIDILIGLEKEEQLDEIIAPLNEMGLYYHKAHELVMPFRRFFIRLNNTSKYPDLPKIMANYAEIPKFETTDKITHIHIVQQDQIFWKEHLLFRDKLRANNETRDAYTNLKTQLSLQEWNKGTDYANAKGDFIKNVLQTP